MSQSRQEPTSCASRKAHKVVDDDQGRRLHRGLERPSSACGYNPSSGLPLPAAPGCLSMREDDGYFTPHVKKRVEVLVRTCALRVPLKYLGT